MSIPSERKKTVRVKISAGRARAGKATFKGESKRVKMYSASAEHASANAGGNYAQLAKRYQQEKWAFSS